MYAQGSCVKRSTYNQHTQNHTHVPTPAFTIHNAHTYTNTHIHFLFLIVKLQFRRISRQPSTERMERHSAPLICTRDAAPDFHKTDRALLRRYENWNRKIYNQKQWMMMMMDGYTAICLIEKKQGVVGTRTRIVVQTKNKITPHTHRIPTRPGFLYTNDLPHFISIFKHDLRHPQHAENVSPSPTHCPFHRTSLGWTQATAWGLVVCVCMGV